jgi:hypothetical protein
MGLHEFSNPAPRSKKDDGCCANVMFKNNDGPTSDQIMELDSRYEKSESNDSEAYEKDLSKLELLPNESDKLD